LTISYINSEFQSQMGEHVANTLWTSLPSGVTSFQSSNKCRFNWENRCKE